MSFSPDSKYLIASPGGLGTAVALNVSTGKAIHIEKPLRKIHDDSRMLFSFLADGNVLTAANYNDSPKAVTVRELQFPSGQLACKHIIPPGPFEQATDPKWIRIRPFGRYSRPWDKSQRAALVELSTGRTILSNNSRAIDIVGSTYAAELSTGQVGLYSLDKGLQAKVALDK
jgi:hypothetical protein